LTPSAARRSLTVLALAALLLSAGGGLLAAPAARADGDPASDVLVGTDVFFPFEPVSHPVARALATTVARMHRLKEPVKVAVIASAVDLGTVTVLFGQPQSYADFLVRRSASSVITLLVVMPQGYGMNGMTPAARAAVQALPKPTGSSATALASAALLAVQKISGANGHPLGPRAGGGRSSSNSTVVIIAVVVAAVLGAASVAAAALRRRQRDTPSARG